MAGSPALGLSKYIVERDLSSLLSLSLKFNDEAGNMVLMTKGKVLVTRQTIEEPNGNVVATVTHKMLSIMPTYEIHDGDFNGQVTAIIKQNFTLSMFLGGQSISIDDASGQPVAVAKGDILGFEFNISAPDGTQIASVSKALGPGVIQALKDAMVSKYVINITNQERAPTVSLLGFLVVLEILMNQHHGSSGGHR